MLIRQAVQADLEILCELHRLWFEEDSFHGLAPAGQEQVEMALGPYFLIAQTEAQVAGFISGSVHVSETTAVMPAGGSYLEIDNLYVRPQFRRQGIGTDLLERLLAAGKASGLTHALLNSS